MPTARDCIAAIRKAAGEGVLSQDAAQELYTRANNLALARAKAKAIPVDEAFTEIAGELKAEERNKAALAKRNAALNVYKKLAMQNTAMSHKSGSYAKGWRAVLESINLSIKDLSDRFHSGFSATAEKLGGREALNAIHKESFDEDALWATVDAMQRGQSVTSKDKIALAIAEAYENFRKEGVSRVNRNGADTRTGPGFLFSRSWSRTKLKDLGMVNGVFDRPTGRKAFRAALEHESIKVDWERTLNGEDREKFWNAFYDNLVNDEHSQKANGDLDTTPGVIQGSVAKRASRPRELWFMDWQSEKAIHDQFSNRSTMATIYSMMHNMARNTALMQVAGPDAVNNLLKTHAKLQELGSKLPEGPEQGDALKKNVYRDMVNMLSGQSASRQNGRWEMAARTLRAVTNLRFAGEFLINQMPDLAFAHHKMTQAGIGGLEMAAMARDAYLGRLAGADKMALWSAQFVAHDSVARHLVTEDGYSWAGDKLDKFNRLTYKLSGVDHHNLAMERAMADGLSHLWAREAHLPFDKLSLEMRRMFEQEPDFTAAHWDAFRKSAWSYSDPERIEWSKDHGVSDEVLDDMSPTGKEKHLTLDGIDRLPREALMPLLEGRFNDTPANLQRVRDELSSMLGRMKENFTDKGMNRPDLRTKAWLGQGIAPGSPWRILADTIGMYKSFIAQTTANVFDDVTQENGWKGFRKYMLSYEGFKSTARLIAMTTIAGYGVLTAKDYLQGRTRRKLLDENGAPNMRVVFAAMQRGSGLGVMSNFLFDEYDRNMRPMSGLLIGPALGQLDPLITGLVDIRQATLEGDDQAVRDLKTGMTSAYSSRLPIPYLNLWYTRPFLNYMVMWNIRDMMSPGILQRQEERVGKQGYQSYWLTPSRAAAIPMDEPGRKMELLLEELSN